MERRSGLGRGLGALIPQDITAPAEGRPAVREVPISQIEPNPYQPRNHFDEESLAGLTASIRELGVLQPILVREVAADRFELIAGERRWRASKRAGLQFMPIIVRDVSDELTLQHALVENLHRDDLNPLEEAAAYQQLIEDFGMTQEAVAHKVGKSRSAVANLLRLFQLPPQVQRMVADGQVSAGHAKALLGTPDRAFQEALATRIASEGLTVRETEEAVRQRTNGAADAGNRTTAGSKLRAPGLLELEQLLADQLDTRVKVTMGPKRGRVVIEFADLEDLERIYREIKPGTSSTAP
ncbi:MAG TPA: ParB/RepB/Spo0J family partition protein [Acidimicrobiales bacterium]|nr:ParB/RepB/Spo0J family partition protein [Acidimicrobiales bacterium]